MGLSHPGSTPTRVARIANADLKNPGDDLQLPDENYGHPQANSGTGKSLVIENLPLSEMQIQEKPATGVIATVRQRYNLEPDTRLRAGWEVYRGHCAE